MTIYIYRINYLYGFGNINEEDMWKDKIFVSSDKNKIEAEKKAFCEEWLDGWDSELGDFDYKGYWKEEYHQILDDSVFNCEI
jgi:hypothetical protein